MTGPVCANCGVPVICSDEHVRYATRGNKEKFEYVCKGSTDITYDEKNIQSKVIVLLNEHAKLKQQIEDIDQSLVLIRREQCMHKFVYDIHHNALRWKRYCPVCELVEETEDTMTAKEWFGLDNY